jgi:hypothetical protein
MAESWQLIKKNPEALKLAIQRQVIDKEAIKTDEATVTAWIN